MFLGGWRGGGGAAAASFPSLLPPTHQAEGRGDATPPRRTKPPGCVNDGVDSLRRTWSTPETTTTTGERHRVTSFWRYDPLRRCEGRRHACRHRQQCPFVSLLSVCHGPPSSVGRTGEQLLELQETRPGGERRVRSCWVRARRILSSSY